MKQADLDGFVRTVARDNARPLHPGETMAKWKFDAHQAQALNRAVAEWIIRSGQHPSAIDGDGFDNLLQLAEPRYVVPTAQYFKDVSIFPFDLRNWFQIGFLNCPYFVQVIFADLYDIMKSLQIESLRDSVPSFESVSLLSGSVLVRSDFVSPGLCPNPLHPIAFTTDLWSGPDHESYICLTAHWLDSEWNLKRSLLDIYLCTDRHTGENLCDWMKDIWKGNQLCV